MAAIIPFAFGPKFQDTMLAMMVKDISFSYKVLKFLDEDHLYSDNQKWLFSLIKDRFEKDGKVPTLLEVEDKIKYADRHKRKLFYTYSQKIFDMSPESPEYIKDALTDFAKRAHFNDLFAYGQTYYNSGKVEEAYKYVMEAINKLYSISFKDDDTISIEEFEALRKRYIAQKHLTTDKISTGIRPLDIVLRGGLSKFEGELGIILAEPKKGKSLALIHMGCMALIKRLGRVCHVILEGSTETTIMRYQSRLSGIPEFRIASDELSTEEAKLLDFISEKYTKRLDLVPFNQHWDYSVADLEAKLSELDRRGRSPDLIVLDYADLMQPREKTREERINQRQVYREIKRLALMRKNAIWTACLSGDTKIQTLKGEIPIKDLVNKKNIPVYAYNHEKKKIEIQTIDKVFKTHDAAEVWEIELDNGKKVKMTPNHKLLLRNGEYKELADCNIGESIMPLYRYEMNYGHRREIFVALNTSPYLRKREARLVADYKLGRLSNSQEHVHHIDNNHFNNDPDNLEILSNSEHKRKHMLKDNWMKTREGKNWWKENNCQFDDEVRKKTSEGMKAVWAMRKKLGIKINTRPDNHKIVAIRKLKVLEPVYNMTVTPSRNYALAAGIIVKNSQAARPKDNPDKETILRGNSISETFEKIRIADFVCSLNQTPKENRLGLVRLFCDVYRNNPCERVIYLLTDFERMIFHKIRYGVVEPEDMPSWAKGGRKRKGIL